MPELPDLTAYVHALRARVVGQPLQRVRIANLFLLRSVDPPIDAFAGQVLEDVRLLGKRLVFAFPAEHFLVLHLMIAGRLHWKPADARFPARSALPRSISPGDAAAHRGGLEASGVAPCRARRRGAGGDGSRWHRRARRVARRVCRASPASATLKRALTDPHVFSGIGNAYSDEILHAARLSPMRQTHQLDDDEITRLYEAAQATLRWWMAHLLEKMGAGFPEKVTAFVEGMAAHGRYRQPCPRCGTNIQRLVYAQNEANYCPACQTVAGCSPTARCRACCGKTGRHRSRRSRITRPRRRTST